MKREVTTVITNYFHRGLPRPDGRCGSCGDQVTSSLASQGQLVDVSDYGQCDQMTLAERLEIDLEHAQDRVREIERQLARAKRAVTTKGPSE